MKVGNVMLHGYYRQRLRTMVGSSAAPYGYTLATWTSGLVITSTQGIPNVVNVLLFMVGAVLGFAFVGALAFGRHNEAPRPGPRRCPPYLGKLPLLLRRARDRGGGTHSSLRGRFRHLASGRVSVHEHLPSGSGSRECPRVRVGHRAKK
jgi:hypothetical protein